MKIILLSDFFAINKEHELLDALFKEGLEYFHLRKRSYTEAEMRLYLEKIPPSCYDKIIIHSHFDLVQEYGLKGLHFKKEFTIENYATSIGLSLSSIRDKYQHLSHSVHSLQDIKENKFPFDYMFLSPVFDSISNLGYNSKIKIQTIRKFFKEEPDHLQIIAITGITDEKVSKVMEAGFNGLGLLGYIWLDYKEDGHVGEAVSRFNKVKKKVELLCAQNQN